VVSVTISIYRRTVAVDAEDGRGSSAKIEIIEAARGRKQ
jgi:hypothetical protein